MARIIKEFALLVDAATMTDVNNPFFTKTPDSIQLSKLPINKAARRFEDQLQDYLVNLANTLMTRPQTNTSAVALQKDAKDKLELYAKQIYWLAVVYVASFFEVTPKLTGRDDNNINSIVDKLDLSIWKRAKDFYARQILREDDKTAQALQAALKNGATPKELKPIFKAKEHKPLNLDKQLKGLATVLTTQSLNIATIDKSRAIIEGIQKGEIISLTKPQRKIASADALSDIQLTLSDDPSVFLSLNYIMWITAEDERVCPQCNLLRNEVFLLTDPTIPIPVRDTHDHCRCRLLLLDPLFDEQNRNQFNVFAA